MTQVQPQGAEPDHPPLSDVIERNIQNQVRLRLEAVSRRTFQERISDAITAFSGSLSFVYLHALWFGLWVLLNMAATEATRRCQRTLVPPARRESAPSPVSVMVSTVVVRSATPSRRTVALRMPMAIAVRAISRYARPLATNGSH